MDSFEPVIQILVDSVKDLPQKDSKELIVDLMLQFIGLVEANGSHLKGPQKLRIVQGALFDTIDKFPDVFEDSNLKEFVHEVVPVLISTSITVAKGFPLFQSKNWCCTK